MMNFASYHKKVTIQTQDKEIVLEDVQLMVSGNFLIANGSPTRDETKKEKYVTTQVYKLSDIIGYDTVTTYYPEEGLENRQQING